MRLQVLSDLHFEFHHDGGEAFVKHCHVPGVDVVILAGDIAVGPGLISALTLFAERNERVVYVHGNHEFYGCDRVEVLEYTERACRRLGNVSFLDCAEVTVCGQRIVGTPLWFPRSEAASRQRALLNDYSQIRDYDQWVYAEHERARVFLEREVRRGDVVVSHHLPTPRSVSPRFQGHPLTCYFVADVSHVIDAAEPALWIHGHTHASIDLELGATRVLCNPFGYLRFEENKAFQPQLVLELSPT